MVECPNCYKKNNDFDDLCECGYRLKSRDSRDEESNYRSKISHHNRDSSSQKNSIEIEFICQFCQSKRIIYPSSEYDAFACQNCHSIFTYNKVGSNYEIRLIKKEIMVPEKIISALKIFEIENNNISLEIVKNKYREYMVRFHPDKVSHLGLDFQRLAEEKSKEANRNFELISEWISKNIKN